MKQEITIGQDQLYVHRKAFFFSNFKKFKTLQNNFC